MDLNRSIHYSKRAIEAAKASAPDLRPVILMGDLNVNLRNIWSREGEVHRQLTAYLVDALHVAFLIQTKRSLDLESMGG